MQYQALRKCTVAILGASREKVNLMARVEDIKTILKSSQVRYLARCASDPCPIEDMEVDGCGKDQTRKGPSS